MRRGESMRVSIKEKLQRRPYAIKTWAIVILVLFVALFVALLVSINQGKSYRTEHYKAINGMAGLKATVSYDCTTSCDQKFDFNVYIFNNDGQQVNVIRPDKDGGINAALSEGDYTMLIGKRFGKDKLFPQEQLSLKNGQELELKLHYK